MCEELACCVLAWECEELVCSVLARGQAMGDAAALNSTARGGRNVTASPHRHAPSGLLSLSFLCGRRHNYRGLGNGFYGFS